MGMPAAWFGHLANITGKSLVFAALSVQTVKNILCSHTQINPFGPCHHWRGAHPASPGRRQVLPAGTCHVKAIASLVSSELPQHFLPSCPQCLFQALPSRAFLTADLLITIPTRGVVSSCGESAWFHNPITPAATPVRGNSPFRDAVSQIIPPSSWAAEALAAPEGTKWQAAFLRVWLVTDQTHAAGARAAKHHVDSH